jgi:hypothetical protein
MIYGLTHKPGKGWDRTVLPRWQYPDLYELKDETVRLDRLIPAKTVAEYEEKRKQQQQGAAPK